MFSKKIIFSQLIILSLFLSACGGGETHIKSKTLNYNFTRINSPYCSNVKYFHYKTPEDANKNHLGNLLKNYSTPSRSKIFVDSRYMDKAEINNFCINNTLSFMETIDLSKPYHNQLEYAGVQHSVGYFYKDGLKLWDKSNGLMLQAYFSTPTYINKGNNNGGGINFVFYLYNKKRDIRLNYVVGVYGFNMNYDKEQKEILYNPTTGIAHISTTIDPKSIYTTKGEGIAYKKVKDVGDNS